MAKAIATISGVALAPGVSRNKRLYTRETIGKMVARANERISAGMRPLSMYVSHDAMDVTGIGGAVTRMWQEQDGSAHYTAEIPDTPAGRAIAALVDPKGGRQFLRGVSILGNWVGPERSESHEGSLVSTGDDFELGRLDFTSNPGVDAAGVNDLSKARKDGESGQYTVSESAPEALVTAITEETTTQPVREDAPAGTGTGVGQVPAGVREALAALLPIPVGEADTPAMSKRKAGLQGGGRVWADPGYQADHRQRYDITDKAHAVTAWRYIHQASKASKYSAAQLKKIRQRIRAALAKFGVKTAAEGWVIEPAFQVTEAVAEWMGDSPGRSGSWSICASNGPVNLNLSSYCMDPADLDVILRAAADAACKALQALDPDMDGDVDVPGADDADTDHDAGHESAPSGTTTESAPAPDSEPGTGSSQEGDAVSTETTAQTGGAADGALTLEQVQKTAADAAAAAVREALVARDEQAKAERKAAKKAAKAAAKEAAQGGSVSEDNAGVKAAVAEALAAAGIAPKEAETEEQRVQRLVAEGVREFIQEATSSGAIIPGRTGMVVREHRTDPDTAPSAEDLSKMSDDDFQAFAGKNLDAYTGDNTRIQSLTQ